MPTIASANGRRWRGGFAVTTVRIPFGFSYRQLQPIRIGRAPGLHLTLRRGETLINEEEKHG
ncbi:hypothetical protein [Bradyrhizobium macuxiense]|uniref:hypothetical protein n=1 Tax=Bradyrhizobium macuxiense TaxID=1755647 RepID=UPI0010A9701C|nr:hypothetical protein [Bradyrhizobium macuxiense]